MSMLVANCPRCKSERVTFDVKEQTPMGFSYGWQRHQEIFCVCRNCHKPTIFNISQRQIEARDIFNPPENIIAYKKSLNDLVNIDGYVSLKDEAAEESPFGLPTEIEALFKEGATCFAVNCWNASASMFRGCLDLATRPLLPPPNTVGITRRQRRDLGPRLEWLFNNGKIPADLRNLSTCVREDGNDAAHQGDLTEVDAEDVKDFTVMLLERLYTEPARLENATARRAARRAARAA